MLILERLRDTAVRIGSDIRVRVVGNPGKNRVRLGLEVPPGIPIWREDRIGGPLDYQDAVIQNSLRVLLVEDDPVHAKVIQRALDRAEAVTAVHFTAAEPALAFLREHAHLPDAPQLVLLDLHLPGMDGLEMLRQLRAAQGLRRLPVVVLSSSDEEHDIQACLDAGANAFVTKTHSYDELTRSMLRLANFWRHTQRVEVKG